MTSVLSFSGFNSRLREEATFFIHSLIIRLIVVSTHASVRRRQPRRPLRIPAFAVSTHASVRRRHEMYSPTSTRSSFNSRLREEATIQFPVAVVIDRRFQLTPP